MYHKRFFLHVPTRSSKAQLEGAVNSANKRREWVRYILADMRTSKRIGEGSLQAGRDEPLHTQPLCVCVCVCGFCLCWGDCLFWLPKRMLAHLATNPLALGAPTGVRKTDYRETHHISRSDTAYTVSRVIFVIVRDL